MWAILSPVMAKAGGEVHPQEQFVFDAHDKRDISEQYTANHVLYLNLVSLKLFFFCV